MLSCRSLGRFHCTRKEKYGEKNRHYFYSSARELTWTLSCLDLAMKSILNAKERSQKQWKELIESTDSRFRETNIAQRSSSQLAMIEYHWSDSGNEHP